MLLQIINTKVGEVFEAFGLDKSLGVVTHSSRPDLSDFQCNGALQAAKVLKRKPLDIANEMQAALVKTGIFSDVSVAGPGFVNLSLTDKFILDTLFNDTHQYKTAAPQKIIIDYGGPNVAKPLHVGHLRSAIIGEAVKRIARELGHTVIADIHLGDWGTPMGMLIAQLNTDHPEWPYFSKDFNAATDTQKPNLTAEDLNELYPQAAKRFKEDETFADQAREATAQLQAGHPGYRKLWRHFVDLSIESIKKDFGALDVDFDLWLGESDADIYTQGIVDDLTKSGIAIVSEGALVVPVAQEGDKYEVPPLILRKKDGAATYGTTDLATIYQRAKDNNPDKVLYVVDQRQSLHFMQVFRAAVKASIIKENHLEHIGFGTMNGKDGKPFKTRAGGVMRLSDLIQNAIDLALKEAGFENNQADEATKEMISKIAIAAIKFGDLSNLRTTDYVFDIDEFVRFDGKTGPYIQYAAVRAGALLAKANGLDLSAAKKQEQFKSKAERDLALTLLGLQEALERAFEKRMPSDVCEYAYTLANRFSSFYRDCYILNEEDEILKNFRLFLTEKTETTLKKSFDCLAIPVPKKMLRAQKAEAA